MVLACALKGNLSDIFDIIPTYNRAHGVLAELHKLSLTAVFIAYSNLCVEKKQIWRVKYLH